MSRTTGMDKSEEDHISDNEDNNTDLATLVRKHVKENKVKYKKMGR